jgi:F0F1-type ATP synthase assembly protein I
LRGDSYGRYSVTPEIKDHDADDKPESASQGTTSAESVAFMVLAGIAVGLGVGAGLDWLVHLFPLFTVIGVFVGFALALYAIYLETK